MKRLMRKNTVELVWWVFVLVVSAIALSNIEWPAEWWRVLLSGGALIVSTIKVAQHWEQV